MAPLLRWWRAQGRPIEVVNEFELRAALSEGYAPKNILVNGPAKHQWLPQFGAPSTVSARFENKCQHARTAPGAPLALPLRNRSVNFDSRAELDALLPIAKILNWRLGIRILTSEEFDPENPPLPTQFGFAPDEAVAALKKFLRAKARIETVRFHLRSNLPSAQIYERIRARRNSAGRRILPARRGCYIKQCGDHGSVRADHFKSLARFAIPVRRSHATDGQKLFRAHPSLFHIK